MKRFFAVIMGIALVLTLVSCASQPGIAGGFAQPATKLNEEVLNAMNGFSVRLFQLAQADKPGSNVFLSPASVWLALGMVRNGAAGSTADGISAAMQTQDIPLNTLNEANRDLVSILTGADPKVTVAAASSIWINKQDAVGIRKTFLDINKKYYGATAEQLDFLSADAPNVVNRWAEKKTNGMIREAVSRDTMEQSVMLLIDAVYFNALWKTPFDPDLTADAMFAPEKSSVLVPFMFSGKKNFGYADQNITAACLQYGSGRLEFAAFMPNDGDLNGFLKDLTSESLQETLNLCTSTDMALYLPKFKSNYDVDLTQLLKRLGMGKAFDQDADFSGIGTSKEGFPLLLSGVGHKSRIDVDEKGTEASTVTVVSAAAAATEPPEKPKELRFDKPFLYLIRDTQTGAILFMGVLVMPTEAGE